MKGMYSADDIMETACDDYCRWPIECEDEDELEEHCQNCKLKRQVFTSVRN